MFDCAIFTRMYGLGQLPNYSQAHQSYPKFWSHNHHESAQYIRKLAHHCSHLYLFRNPHLALSFRQMLIQVLMRVSYPFQAQQHRP